MGIPHASRMDALAQLPVRHIGSRVCGRTAAATTSCAVPVALAHSASSRAVLAADPAAPVTRDPFTDAKSDILDA